MVKKIIICLAFLLVISAVYADVSFDFNPPVNVFAESEQNIVIRFTDADTNTAVKSIAITMDSGGRANTIFSTNKETVNAEIYIISVKEDFLKEENIIKKINAGPFSTESAISINLLTNTFNDIKPVVVPEPVKNNSANITSEILENNTEVFVVDASATSDGGLTGAAVSDESKSLIDKSFIIKIVYVIGGIVVLGGVLFFLLMVGKRSRTIKKEEPVVRKLSEQRLEEAERKVSEAERELKEAREEITEIRKEDGEVLEAEKQFEEAKEKLEKLRQQTKEMKSNAEESKNNQDNFIQ